MKFGEQRTFENMPVMPADIRRQYESSRIDMDVKSFEVLYSSARKDGQFAERVRRQHEGQTAQDIGFFAEALVHSCVQRGAFGKGVSARAPADYDDVVHGADVILQYEGEGMKEPVVSSVDVTIAQQFPREARGFHEESIVGRKLLKIRSYIDNIASYSREDAIRLHVWITNGGLAQAVTNENKDFFEEAEKIMTLKYYKNPMSSDEPGKPRFVLAGPQAVVSLDRVSVDKALNDKDQKASTQAIDALVQTEVPFIIASLSQYVSKTGQRLKQEGRGSNLFLDMLESSYKSWEMTFSSDIAQMKVQRALKKCLEDPSLRSHVTQYRESVNKILR